MPATHDEPLGHTVLQAPQFHVSVWESTHVWPHHNLSAVQRDTHLPALHFWSLGHWFEHWPQFELSVWRSVHVLLQKLRLSSHVHTPFVQTAFWPHDRPHPPQFAPSVLTSTHEFPHAVSPDAHFETHLPCEQSSLLLHGAPHWPQFAPSEPVSEHFPLHEIFPSGHWHTPSLHVAPLSHATPHPPQLFGSVLRSMQTPAQNVRPFWHES